MVSLVLRKNPKPQFSVFPLPRNTTSAPLLPLLTSCLALPHSRFPSPLSHRTSPAAALLRAPVLPSCRSPVTPVLLCCRLLLDRDHYRQVFDTCFLFHFLIIVRVDSKGLPQCSRALYAACRYFLSAQELGLGRGGPFRIPSRRFGVALARANLAFRFGL